MLLLSFARAVRAMACANYSFSQLTLGHIHVTFEEKA